MAVFPSPKDGSHVHSGLFDIICLTELNIFSTSNPARIFEPASMVSGLSVVSRIVTHGFLKYNVSSRRITFEFL